MVLQERDVVMEREREQPYLSHELMPKQIMFLSNNRIGASDGLTGKRRVHGKRERATIPEP